MPSCFMDYNSISNPLLAYYAPSISSKHDLRHIFTKWTAVGLGIQEPENMIDQGILTRYGAKEVFFDKGEVIIRADEEALNYFQILKGSVKMFTNSPDGQEFIQGIFKTNDSFGEPALLCSFPYPSTATTLEPSVIIKLNKERFLLLLKENFEIHLHLDQILCQRLKYKSMILSEISFYDPEHRILSLLKYLKNNSTNNMALSNGITRSNHAYIVPFTRQQIADMSGLRVETVIRTVKKMQGDGKLHLVDRKIAI